MKSYLPLFLCLLLLFGRSASAEDGAVDSDAKMNMKNFTSAVLFAQTNGANRNPKWRRGEKILGWRFLDKNHQSLGKIQDIILNGENGEFEWVKVRPDRLNFVEELGFDRVAHNIRMEGQVMFCDLDKKQIESNSEIFENLPLNQENQISLEKLLGSSAVLKDGTIIGKIIDSLSSDKATEVEFLVVMLDGERETVSIPFESVRILVKEGELNVEISPEQLKIMQQFAK
ncbi:MAG TPA: PRC-barrel domain-containing protein [Alphaproteobacteria bacterium]|jgi:sporulation protein YlmC with PRC-barrel domain|nr:PRC-barrel domain-containing protein [Alphaproteobacteria bacterium]HRK97563.1 PRC-barrel domain-containing protein [Alphaproteobacteria bacterium]